MREISIFDKYDLTDYQLDEKLRAHAKKGI